VIQKGKKVKITDFSEEIITDIQFTKEELITNQETESYKKKNIEVLLNKLPKRQKEAIYLKYYSELKTAEIAEIMNINYQSVVNTLHMLNVLPEWAFKAENADGQAIIDDTSIISIADGGSGLTQLENEANAITFNGRYSQMTYDGSHFSQLGTMFNLSLNYQF
jgi:hypothetical protein